MASKKEFNVQPVRAFANERTPKDQLHTPNTKGFLAFAVFLASRVVASCYSPIQDCDEVFNFWEPTHYLNHGFGLQTWELSPEYAIRSWLYTAMHALPIALMAKLPFISSKVLQFYSMRLLLAAVCAWCDSTLYIALKRSMSPKIARLYLLISVSSAGMFHASVAYLPSSFAMYTLALALSSYLRRDKVSSISQYLTWIALGTVVGWPFIAVLAVPFVFEGFVTSYMVHDIVSFTKRLLASSIGPFLILVSEIGIDSLFYRKFVSIPFNIVWYNVFATGKGPDIYGTEPWHFYIRNLIINFNVWFILAGLSMPLVALHRLLNNRTESKLSAFRIAATLAPFYMWLLIFTAQPHKEERFMYPVYPLICVNAAVGMHVILVNLGASSQDSIVKIIPARLRLLLTSTIILTATLLGISRSAGLTTAYSAPLQLFGNLEHSLNITGISGPPKNICIGKEWYRYPSSYLVPDYARLRFIKSEFSGLLPGPFFEATHVWPFSRPGTYLIPDGMNDQNLEDLGKYTSLDECDYLIDSSLVTWEPTQLEPDYIHDNKHWQVLECAPFLDAAGSSLVARLFWLPDTKYVPQRFRRKWGQYCLLQKRI